MNNFRHSKPYEKFIETKIKQITVYLYCYMLFIEYTICKSTSAHVLTMTYTVE